MRMPAVSVNNPVLGKELRTRMRGTRAYWVLFAHVMLLSVALFIAYLFMYQRFVGASYVVGMDPVGRMLFQVLFVAQAIFLSMITPALTAGMITIEREQRTYELLMLTMLRPREVASGKLLSAFGFAVLLLTASLPLAGICFMMGGVSQQEILVVYVMLAVASLFYGALGLLFSAMMRTTAVSTASTYVVALAIFVVTALLASAGRNEVLFAATNPITAVFSSLEKAPFYRWQVPIWIPSLLISLLAALLAAAGTVHKMEEGVSERPGALRWITYAFVTALAVGVIGNIVGVLPRGAGIDDLRVTATVFAGVLLVSLATLAIVYCSADAPEVLGTPSPGLTGPRPSGILGRILYSRLFTGGYASAPAYVLFLFVTGAAVIATSFAIAGHAAWILVIDTVVAALLVALAGVLFCMTLSRLFSVLTGNRNQAGMLVCLVAGALLILPLFSLIGWDPSVQQPHRLAWETLYLNPAFAFIALGSEPGNWKDLSPPLWAGQGLTWAMTLFIYLALAAVVEAWGQAALRAKRAQQKPAMPPALSFEPEEPAEAPEPAEPAESAETTGPDEPARPADS